MADLWRPPTGVGLLKHHATSKTVTLPDGTRALVTLDDSGTVEHTETPERLDVVVRPRTVRIQIRKGRGNVESR
ncbi:hypothetical protein [Kribbella sp. NPDC051718]|uniref:hypothetical protein n=1 Tax=Kribbella sp. NPDC051718 TaxID=3155168 RepID=UPI0034425ECD